MSNQDTQTVADRAELTNMCGPHRRFPSGGGCYKITVAGHLDEHWVGWVGKLTITHDPIGNTHLSGPIQDQAALHGILVQIRDLGLTLIAITPIGTDGDSFE